VTINVSKHMNKIINVHVDDFDCLIESGVTRKQLNNHLKDSGLWFPIGKIFMPLNQFL
jgi:D-lactate dehydrogenase (cytochrome)